MQTTIDEIWRDLDELDGSGLKRYYWYNMRIIHRLDEMTETARGWLAGGSVGYIPTAEFVQEGLLQLIQAARQECEISVVSISANPIRTEYGGLTRSPSDIARDLQLLETAQVDIVFNPRPEDFFLPDFSTYIMPVGFIAKRLERISSPDFLRDFTTGMVKFLQLVRPDVAYFEQKDALKVALIRQVVRDLNIDVGLRILPTTREDSGLAMSGYNHLLNGPERQAASRLYAALQLGKALIEGGERHSSVIIAAMQAHIAAEPLLTLDYATVCHPDLFNELDEVAPRAMLTIAAHIRNVLLTDNIVWLGGGHWLL